MTSSPWTKPKAEYKEPTDGYNVDERQSNHQPVFCKTMLQFISNNFFSKMSNWKYWYTPKQAFHRIYILIEHYSRSYQNLTRYVYPLNSGQDFKSCCVNFKQILDQTLFNILYCFFHLFVPNIHCTKSKPIL